MLAGPVRNCYCHKQVNVIISNVVLCCELDCLGIGLNLNLGHRQVLIPVGHCLAGFHQSLTHTSTYILTLLAVMTIT